ncbi:MAG: thiamine pyrophosphate-binding protein [Bryobacteraceae bacterium]
MTHSEAIAQTLAARGVETVFGLPGGEILAFVDACRRSGLRFLLTGHEASAAWMAQITGQLTGIPGVCAATLGPGATNLVTGIASALLERAPMIAISAQTPNREIATATHQRLDLPRLFQPISKGVVTAGDGDTAAMTNSAVDLALAPRSGPVYLALPSDVATQECGPRMAESRSSDIRKPSAGVQDIADRIAASKRPLLLIGLGATPAMAPAIAALIVRLQAPFLVTPKVKGIVSEEHPLFLGVASGMALDREIVATLREADLVIGIGFDPVESDKTWFASLDVAALDTVSMVEGSYSPTEALGELSVLIAELAAIAPARPWPEELLSQRHEAMRPRFLDAPAGLSPLRLIEELRSVFPRDGIAACDVGSHKLAIGQFWRAYEPGTFLMANGLSGMGFGLPAAMAAQLVYPNRPVMAMVGDGGMLMMLHDLVIIRELRLPIVIVVFTDASLSLIRLAAERRKFEPVGVDFLPPDFAAAAQAFGIEGRRASTIAEARSLAEQALARRVPYLIEAPVDYHEYREVIG